MAYTISSVLAIYFVLWWVVLFITLPFGVRSQDEANETIEGTDPGAPVRAMMARKLIWTTIVSAIIFAVAMVFYQLGYLNVGRLSDLMGLSAGRLKMN
jgi:predicted secreted protein